VGVSALAMVEDIDKARRLGFDGYVTKPYKVAELVKQLNLIVTRFLKKKGTSEHERITGAN
jgi:DNA-binding response OmpR family regulator